jgi:oligopeptide transport system substrate-binding protein
VLVAAFLVLLPACTGADEPSCQTETAEPQSGGTFSMALVEPRSLDPVLAERAAERVLAANLFDGLTALGRCAGVRPAVASGWTSDEEGRRFEFTLREDARYADGTPVTAQDFVAAWERASGSERASVRALLAGVQGADDPEGEGLTGVTAPDDHTLVVQLVEPDAGFPAVAADPALAPLPPQALDDPEAWARQPLGNGPFALAPGDGGGGGDDGGGDDGEGAQDPQASGVRTLVPNPSYAGDAPHLDEVEIRTVPDELTAWLYFQEGQVDFAPVPLAQVPAARDLYGHAEDSREDAGVVDSALAAVDVLTYDLSSPPWDDHRLRVAVALAIDRGALAEPFAGTRVPADGAVPDGVRSASGDPCEPCGHNPERAQELVDELVEERGDLDPLTLVVPDSPAAQAIAQQITSDLAEVGLDVSVEPPGDGDPAGDGAEAAAGEAGDAGEAGEGGQAEGATPGAATLSLASAPAGLALDRFLTTWYVDREASAPESDGSAADLLAQAAASPKEADRLDLARRALEQLESDVVVVPLLERRHRAVLASGVQGLELLPDNVIDLAAVSRAD